VPHIIVMADNETDSTRGAVMLRERISASDLTSHHFGRQLLERLNWAVSDAHAAEGSRDRTDPSAGDEDRARHPITGRPRRGQRSDSVVTTAS
jgi:hypothetical protein